MSSKFTKEKQLAFGSIIGGFLSAVQRENELSDNDMVALVLNVAAGQASIARWSLESFMGQAQRAFQQSAAVIRPDAPAPRSESTRWCGTCGTFSPDAPEPGSESTRWCGTCRTFEIDGRCCC